MSPVVGNRYLVVLFRLLLAAVFLVSAYGKLVDIQRYSVDGVIEFGILPVAFARLFGFVTPFIELFCGLGLLFGALTRLSAAVLALMSLSFFAAKAVMLGQGRDLNCGCFGAIIETLASITMFMDIPLTVLALLIMFAPDRSRHWAALGKWLPCAWEKRLRWIW